MREVQGEEEALAGALALRWLPDDDAEGGLLGDVEKEATTVLLIVDEGV